MVAAEHAPPTSRSFYGEVSHDLLEANVREWVEAEKY